VFELVRTVERPIGVDGIGRSHSLVKLRMYVLRRQHMSGYLGKLDIRDCKDSD